MRIIGIKRLYIYLYNIMNVFGKDFANRGEAAKLAHLIESASLKRKYMTKNYEKIFI